MTSSSVSVISIELTKSDLQDKNYYYLDIDWFLCDEDSDTTPVTLNKMIDISGIIFNGRQTTLSISYWNSNVTSEKESIQE